MSPHRKAKKIDTPISPELQAARERRELGRSNRFAVADALGALRRIQRITDCKGHYREAVHGLFGVIQEAQRALLRVTGAPGVIFQFEVDECCKERDVWCENRIARRPTEFPAPWRHAMDKLAAKVKAGWLVEPGLLFLGYDRTQAVVMGNRYREGGRPTVPNPRTPSPVTHRGPRPVRMDVPSVEQLEAWYVLPTDPPQAEGSQSRS